MFGWFWKWLYSPAWWIPSVPPPYKENEGEAMVTDCPYCGKPVVSYWRNGCVSMPEKYVLIADWIFHSECWDLQVTAYEFEQEKRDAASDGRTEGEVDGTGRLPW